MNKLFIALFFFICYSAISQVRYTGSNLGVGTNSPSSTLNVHGSAPNIEISNTSETESGLLFYDHGYESTQSAAIKFDCAGSNALNFYYKNSTPSISIASNVTIKNHVFTTTTLTVYGHLHTNAGNSQLGSFSKPWYQGRIKYLYRDYEYSLSDKSVKRDIKPMKKSIEVITKLSPVSYYMKDTSNTKKHYGFVAQDVHEILPELTSYDHEQELMYLNYEGLIPVLVGALQEEHQKLLELEEELETLVKDSKKRGFRSNEPSVSNSFLQQNHPNPFSNSTLIQFEINESATTAQLYIFDFNGNLEMTFDIDSKGSGSIEISGNKLTPGIYHYSLIVDNIEVDTKKMILTK